MLTDNELQNSLIWKVVTKNLERHIIASKKYLQNDMVPEIFCGTV